MISERRSLLVRAVAIALPLLLPACSSSESPVAPPSPPPTTLPPPRVVSESNFSLQANFVRGQFFSTDRAGTIDASVDYTFANSAIVVWIARGQCTADQFFAEQCTFPATSFAGPKPRKVSVTGAAAGDYTLIIGNAGPQDESISYQVVLTVTGAASLAGPAVIRSVNPPFVGRLPPHYRLRP